MKEEDIEERNEVDVEECGIWLDDFASPPRSLVCCSLYIFPRSSRQRPHAPPVAPAYSQRRSG